MQVRIPQMELVTEIIDLVNRHAKRQGIKNLPAEHYQINGIIAAANIIVEQMGRERRPATPGMGLSAWLNCDDTGTSSEAMAYRLTGICPPNMRNQEDKLAIPRDPDDFGRCHRFLEAVPDCRAKVPLMADVSETWAKLAAAWEELTALYLEELPTGQCPKLYARMQELGC